MQREIKFRAWDLVSSTMRHVSFIEFDAAGEICNIALAAPGVDTKHGHHARFEERENGEDLILMQFTGVKDKNAKDIFEGDIVGYGKGEAPWEVHWSEKYEKMMWGDFALTAGSAKNLKAIGNVYQNPELLPQ